MEVRSSKKLYGEVAREKQLENQLEVDILQYIGSKWSKPERIQLQILLLF